MDKWLKIKKPQDGANISLETRKDMGGRASTSKVNMEQSPSANCQLPGVKISPKFKKKRKRHNIFHNTWLNDPRFAEWLKQHDKKKNGNEMAYCTSCEQVLVAHKSDLLRHSKSKRHQHIIKQATSSQKLPLMIKNSNFEVRRAELKIAAFIAANDLPFLVANTLVPLCSNIFPDSEIAKKMASKRTKITMLVKDVLCKSFSQDIVNKIHGHGSYFSLIMDETTDKTTKKQCAFAVIYFDKEKQVVETNFLCMVEIAASSAEEIYQNLKNVLSVRNIPMSNMIGFSSDTTNVMAGRYNSVFAYLKRDFPHIACIKCSCHMINLSANKACLKLPRSIEDLLRNIGSHFNRSAKRVNTFMEFQEYFEVSIHRILSPSQTRWLSVKSCVDRVLEQYSALNSYFRLSVFEDPSRTTEDMLSTMDNKFTIIYLEFMSYVLGLTCNFNKLFQSEMPLLHKLKSEVTSMVKSLACNYIRVDYVRSCQNILKAEFRNSKFFIDINQIYLGVAATECLQNLRKDSSISNTSITDFLTTCQSFYVELVCDIVKRFDFSDPLFDIIDIVDPKFAQAFEVKSLRNIFHRFPMLAQHVDEQILDSEWRSHALLDFNSLNVDSEKSADEYWKNVFSLKNSTGSYLFPNLQFVIGTLMSLPFSNACVERVFSNLNNIKTKNRNKLNTDTVNALITVRNGVFKNEGCVGFEPNREMLAYKSFK